MKMSIFLSFCVVIFATSFIPVDGTNMCKRALTKRLLRMVGVNPEKSPCLIRTKREMAHFIDTILDDIRERAFLEDEDMKIAKEWELTKRGKYDGKFCCSPTCDRYMAHMGATPEHVEC